MKKVKKILKFIFIGLLVFLVGWTFYFLYTKSKPKEIVYEIVSPKKQSIKKSTIITGKISPRDEILIKPQISGIVSDVYKEAGQKVTSGEVIAKVKVIPDVGSLNNAESNVRTAEINLTQATQEFERQKKLFEKGIITREEYEKSETAHKTAKENYETSQDALQIIKEGISERTAKYSSTLIRSTISGLILDVPVKAGNSVIQSNTFNDGTTIASVANMNDMIFIGNVDETEVGRIKEGMTMTLTIGALQDVKLDATLEYISPKGVESTGGANQFEIKAAAKMKEDIFIRAGYSANAEIILAAVDSVLSIPENTVEFSNDSSFVQIVKSEKPIQVFEKRFVELGLSDGVNIEIKSGLTAEDKIRGTVATSDKKN
ncbi:MAG: efflux RND transporter periplasmic adaptor subunit [Prevotellaceae bacterium]|jgi:HlyD family secretion protein|nr:efflux RND transporter periplasmic adaptor subunit [Prevotellaceae bacterium]